MVVTDPTHRVTGVLTPDSTGDYWPRGIHNGKTYYSRGDNAWFIWWDNIDTWWISSTLGILTANKWLLTAPDVEGLYTAVPPAAGVATVAEI